MADFLSTPTAPPIEEDLRFNWPDDVLSTTATNLRQRLDALLCASDRSIRVFHLDLRSARMVDSVGLNLLVWLIRSVRARGGKVTVTVGNANVLRIFRFTRLDKELEVIEV